MAAVAQQERWPAEWAYDGGKSIFALRNFLPQHENTMEVDPSPATLPAIWTIIQGCAHNLLMSLAVHCLVSMDTDPMMPCPT